MPKRTFTCECCGGTFDSALSLGEAWDEARARFPEVTAPITADNFGQVCDDCNARFTAWFATLSEDQKAAMRAGYEAPKKEG